MERILKGTVATLSVTFAVDGTPTDPSPTTATIEIVRADGTVLVAEGTATSRTDVGEFTYTLTALDTALLDLMTLRWTSSLGTIETTAEIVGGFLFSLADARATPPLNSTELYPTDAIVQTRTLVETAIEDACGRAFVPRYRHETVTGEGRLLKLSRPEIRAIRSATISGTAVTVNDLSFEAGFVHGAYWGDRFGAVVIGYEHGHDAPPAPIRYAALQLARHYLTNATSVGAIDPRAESIVTDDGTLRFALSSGRFGLPDVDRVIDAYRVPMLL